MNVIQFKGPNHWYENRTIDFFGVAGAVFDEGRWLFNGGGGSIFKEIEPVDALGSVTRLIQQIVEPQEAVDTVVVSPANAVYLTLQGVLSLEQLLPDQVVSGDGFIVVPQVTLGSWTFNVRIERNPQYVVSLVDPHGDFLASYY